MIAFRILRDGTEALALRSTAIRVQQAVRTSVTRLTLRVLAHVKAEKLSGQVLKNRTGTLRRSVNSQVADTGSEVRGQVGTNLEYAAAHEYGFRGEVTVKAHWREVRRAFKQRIPARSVRVDAFRRQMHLPERSFLRSALSDLGPEVRDTLTAAVSQAVRGTPASSR